jgi:hypothetical protein
VLEEGIEASSRRCRRQHLGVLPLELETSFECVEEPLLVVNDQDLHSTSSTARPV